jgi:7-carboxy-7-deazaguanine synthase
MNNRKLAVAETFYSIQGEGTSSGCPAVFLRLGGCNLLCKGKGWECDTIAVWKNSRSVHFDDVLTHDQIDKLCNGAHLVITGGEPLLHQDRLLHFIDYLYNTHNCKPYIEVETNGTLLPLKPFAYFIDQWNVSFKLSNSGECWNRRVNEVALRYFNDQLNAQFKIVIANEADVLELMQDFDFINMSKVILMPAGATQEELNITRPIVVELCKRLIFRYTERQHIVIWNKKTGV